MVALVLMATAIAMVVVASSAEDEYQSSVSVLALRPAFVEADGGFVNINPLLSDGRNVSLTAAALIDIVNSPNFALRTKDAGVSSDYSIAFNPSGGGALLSLSAIGDTPAGVVDDLQTIFELTSEELDLLQDRAGVSAELRVNLRVSSSPTLPTPLFASKARSVLATAVLGIGAAINFAFAASALRRRRESPGGDEFDFSTVVEPNLADPREDELPLDDRVTAQSAGRAGPT